MNKSDSIKNITQALLKVQAEMPPVTFDSTNKFLGNRYVSFGKVIETAKPVLAKHEIMLSQPVVGGEGQIGVETILLHSSGEWISSIAMIPIDSEKGKSAAQVAGSNISYLRRYSLSAMLGIYSEEDTDGNSGSPIPAQRPRPRQPEANTDGKAPEITIEEAWKVRNSRGVEYGSMSEPVLRKIITSLLNQLGGGEEVPEQKRKEMRYKLLAAQTVARAKRDGSAQ